MSQTAQSIDASDLEGCLDALNRFAMTLTRDPDRASDLVQDCVERCLRKQHLFDGRNLRSWMFTVCRRLFVNQVRRDNSRGFSVELDDMTGGAVSVAPSQESRMHYADVLDQVASLSAEDQALLALVAVEGLKYDEAAARLDVPIGTIRSRLSRARSKLRTGLDDPAAQSPTLH